MHKKAAGHLQFIAWGFIFCVVVGLLVGELAWVLCAALLVYLVWSVRQAVRLHHWLYEKKGPSDIPESYGLWGDLFDGLHQVQQQNKQTQASLKAMIQRVRSSTNALKEAVVMTNEEGQMEWWNDSAERMFGFREDQDVGQLMTNLIRDPDFKLYFDSKDYEEALEIQSPLDPHTLIRVYITLFGREDRLIFAQDVTRIHQLEQMRRDFVSNVSHEMRTPLTVIHGYIETLQDAPNVPEKWQRPLRSMADQTRRLELLVSDLLLLEKYESQDPHRVSHRVDVEKLLLSICHDAQVLSGEREHNIRLRCDSSDTIIGEEGQLRSAFSNLIYNAVKYTPTGGDIDVHWYRDHRGGHLSVKDTGCGFDPVHIPRLTERFYRADPSRNKGTGGSGLGLAIVKHVLINHNASLAIQSQENVGSKFTCHFPPSALEVNSLEANAPEPSFDSRSA